MEYTSRFNNDRITDRKIDELTGLSTGMIADGEINELEILFLKDWLIRNKGYTDTWPISILAKQVFNVLEDGIITDDEKKQLLDTLTELSDPSALTKSHTPSTLPLCDPAPKVIFKDRIFVFTGNFYSATRRQCEIETTIRNGIHKKAVGQKTAYLVIGGKGSNDWMHATWGRKIETAQRLKEDGFKIAIISEEHWLDHILLTPVESSSTPQA